MVKFTVVVCCCHFGTWTQIHSSTFSKLYAEIWLGSGLGREKLVWFRRFKDKMTGLDLFKLQVRCFTMY